jgi:hypothetical protein
MNRRRLLAVLGLGSVGGLGVLDQTGVVDVDDRITDALDAGGTAGDGDGYVSQTAELVDAIDEDRTRMPAPFAEFSFASEHEEFTTPESRYFDAVAVTPADGTPGDTLRVTPAAENSAPEIATLLRDVWTVGTDHAYAIQVGETSVAFEGGTQGEVAALVGTHQAGDEESVVLVARAPDVATAETIADTFAE